MRLSESRPLGRLSCLDSCRHQSPPERMLIGQHRSNRAISSSLHVWKYRVRHTMGGCQSERPASEEMRPAWPAQSGCLKTCRGRLYRERVLGRIASFVDIAKREAKGDRHIRLAAPLAFVSPRIIATIVGTAPQNLTVTVSPKRCWQEHITGLPR